jgi:hypothetical protein
MPKPDPLQAMAEAEQHQPAKEGQIRLSPLEIAEENVAD